MREAVFVLLVFILVFGTLIGAAWHVNKMQPAGYGTPCSDPSPGYMSYEACESTRLLLGLKGHCAQLH